MKVRCLKNSNRLFPLPGTGDNKSKQDQKQETGDTDFNIHFNLTNYP